METIYCTMTEKRYTKKPGTKTVYIMTEEKTKALPEQHYINMIEAAPFFRRLGGSETLTRSYTCRGYKVVELISKSPDRDTKIVRTFNFDINN